MSAPREGSVPGVHVYNMPEHDNAAKEKIESILAVVLAEVARQEATGLSRETLSPLGDAVSEAAWYIRKAMRLSTEP